jgi:hypothetical protein
MGNRATASARRIRGAVVIMTLSACVVTSTMVTMGHVVNVGVSVISLGGGVEIVLLDQSLCQAFKRASVSRITLGSTQNYKSDRTANGQVLLNWDQLCRDILARLREGTTLGKTGQLSAITDIKGPRDACVLLVMYGQRATA